MENYERDILVSQIKSGYIYLKKDIKLKPMSIDLYAESMLIYQDAYTEALSQELLTLKDSIKYLEITGFYSSNDKEKEKKLEKDLKSAQIELYNSRHKIKELSSSRKRLYHLKSSADKLSNKKYSLYEHTCEYYADSEKMNWLLPKLLLDSNNNTHSPRYLHSLYNQSTIPESDIRELCLNDPWRSSWVIRDHKPILQEHANCELNHNQKSIMLWSLTYDNIRQSMDAPEEKFYEDNDIIDAWFVWSKDKHEKEKAKSEAESKINKNSKIQSSPHVFLMADPDDPDSVSQIHDLNDFGGKQYIERLNREVNNTGGGSLFKMKTEQNRVKMDKK